jgi:Fic family protein
MDIIKRMNLWEKKIQITPKILKLIAEIDEFKGSWAALGQLAPDKLIGLKRVATIESVASSTRIEGVKLSDSEVKALLTGLNINSLKNRDEEEVAGYADLMNLIFESHRELPFSENIIKQLHQILLQYSSKDSRHRGEYKKLNNHVEAVDADGNSLGVVFQTTTPLETPYQMEALVSWCSKSLRDPEVHVLVTIAVFILSFLAIHPFQDGNGRLSRALTALLLLKTGYDYIPYASLERIVEDNKDLYYFKLREGQTEEGESSQGLVSWVQFFLDCLVKQKNNLKSKVEAEKRLVSLPKLSAKILVSLKQHEKLAISDLVKLTGANRNTIKAHVATLVEKEKIEKHGVGRGTYYTL